MYAMGAFADDREMKLNSVHPSQHGKAENTPDGAEMRLPGGAIGYKK